MSLHLKVGVSGGKKLQNVLMDKPKWFCYAKQTICSRPRRGSSGLVSEKSQNQICLYLCIYSSCLVCCDLCSLAVFRLGFLSCLQKFSFCLFNPQFLSCWFQTASPSHWIWTKWNDPLFLSLVVSCKSWDVCKGSMNLLCKQLRAKTIFLCEHSEISPGASHRCLSLRQLAIC